MCSSTLGRYEDLLACGTDEKSCKITQSNYASSDYHPTASLSAKGQQILGWLAQTGTALIEALSVWAKTTFRASAE